MDKDRIRDEAKRDQMLAGSRDLTDRLRVFYTSCKDSGFTPAESIQLTCAFVRGLMAMGRD